VGKTMSNSDVAEPKAVATPARVPSWPWWLLRGGVTSQAISTALQPIFMGAFLSGDYDMLALHKINGILVGVISVVLIVAAVLAWRIGQAPGRLATAVVFLTLAVGEQIHSGFSRTLALHVPLGVAVVGLTGWLLVWVWRHGPTQPGSQRSGS
jgi:hypothetical protein